MKITFQTHGDFLEPIVNAGQKDERRLSPAEKLSLVNFLNTSIIFGDTILEAQQVQEAAERGFGKKKEEKVPAEVVKSPVDAQ